MPIHDWSRVSAGTFHDFHTSWIAEFKRALNAGILPDGYYAMAEQVVGVMGPDVLVLEQTPQTEAEMPESGALAVAVAPPQVSVTAMAEMDAYRLKQRTLVVRHGSDDRIVALVEIVSPGNKSSRHALQSFVNKALAALACGYHLTIADLHRPGSFDPDGIHGAIWAELDGGFDAPTDKPLTFASYSAGDIKRAYVEPLPLGAELPDMPLFLSPDYYVPLPMAATYDAAFETMGKRWRDELQASNE
jgi:hypothetical protein